MTDNSLIEVLRNYGVDQPHIELLRHNEKKTYKVNDLIKRKLFLFRIHLPLTENFAGLQHTYNGLPSELQLLLEIAEHSGLIVQQPIRNCYGNFITKIDYEGKQAYCSLLTWIEGKDLQNEDLSDIRVVTLLGTKIAELHRFFQEFDENEKEYMLI
ncbi:MAG TPA: hypothetical protein VGE40_10265 [Bacilli bacterium]